MTWYAKKLDLERLIYSFGVPIEAQKGELYSDAVIPHLQVALSVYNAFFAAENRAFLAEDIRQEKADLEIWRRYYDAEEKRLGAPLSPAFALYTRAKEDEIKKEFICREKKANKNAKRVSFAV